MKAIVYEKYGSPDVLELKDVEKPTPNENEVLLTVHAASINSLDWDMLTGRPLEYRLFFGLLKSKYKILGCDIAGRIEAVGRNIKQFHPGDDVFGDLCETAEAFQYFGEGHFKGKIVIAVENNNKT